jgi:hypothetical protein
MTGWISVDEASIYILVCQIIADLQIMIVKFRSVLPANTGVFRITTQISRTILDSLAPDKASDERCLSTIRTSTYVYTQKPS